jgi:hypothetical protein
MARLRHALKAALAFTLAGFWPRATSAQSCHVPPPQALQEPSWRLRLGQETARFESPRYEGHYQGLSLGVRLANARLSAGAALSVYRIVRNGLASRGLGDLSLHSHAALLGSSRGKARAGLVLGITLPTGDATADLGMGHAMLMSGAWATARVHQLLVSSQITYGKALRGNNAHHHHDSFGPLVAPMSPSELGATLSASAPIYQGATGVRLRGGVDGAQPILDKAATARASLLVGLLLGDRVQTSFELKLPIVGEPSTLKLVLELSLGIR